MFNFFDPCILFIERTITKSTLFFYVYLQATSEINESHILDPLCEWLYPEVSLRRSRIQKYHSKVPPLSCRVFFMMPY
jgi:hypothetical protein